MGKLHVPLLPKGGLGVLALVLILLISCSQSEIIAKPTVEQAISEAVTQLSDNKAAEIPLQAPKATGVVSLDEPKPKIEPELVKELKELKRQKKHKRVTVLVELKDESALEAVEQAGGTILQNFDIGNVAVVEVQSDKIEELSNTAGIEQVASEKEYVALLADRIPAFSIDTAAWENNITGKGVKIAILDTGVGPHDKISVTSEASFVENENESDQNGHGTHVAGIAQGVAKDSTIYNAKVLNKAGAGTTSQIIAGINWAVEQDVDIISMSFGGMFTELDGPLASAVKEAIENGVVFVVAAGNCKTGCGGFYGVTTPGNVKEVITVGAVDDSNVILSFSSGDTFDGYVKPDVVGPGKDITSLWLNNGEKTISGTSMSTPFVAGIAALLLEKEPGLTNEQVKERLESTAEDKGTPGKDTSYGSGVADVPALLNDNITFTAPEQAPIPNDTISDDDSLFLSLTDKIFVETFAYEHSAGIKSEAAVYQHPEEYFTRVSYTLFEKPEQLQDFLSKNTPYDHKVSVSGHDVFYATKEHFVFWTHDNIFFWVMWTNLDIAPDSNGVLAAYVSAYKPNGQFEAQQLLSVVFAAMEGLNLTSQSLLSEIGTETTIQNTGCTDAPCDNGDYKTDLSGTTCHLKINTLTKGTTHSAEWDCMNDKTDACTDSTHVKEYYLNCDGGTAGTWCSCAGWFCDPDLVVSTTKDCTTSWGSNYVCQGDRCVQGSSCDYNPACTNNQERKCTGTSNYDLSTASTACSGGCSSYAYQNTYSCSTGKYCQGTTYSSSSSPQLPCYTCSTACDGSCQSGACSGTDPDCTSSGGVNPNACVCSITSTAWSPSGTVQEGTQVQLIAYGTSSCAGKSAQYDIFEDDLLSDDYIETLTDTTFSNGKFSMPWTAFFQGDGSPESQYYFKVTPTGGSTKTSGLLTVVQTALTCNNNGVCDSGENSNNCPNDCVVNPCNNNGACEPGETTTNCPNDCTTNPCNNNGQCEAGEDVGNCPNDCTITPTCTDADGDGYGSPASSVCNGGSQTDCDDNNANVHPGAAENCNDNLDNNCNGQTNENCCGNGQCNTFENPASCSQDCYGNLQVISIVSAPSEVDQGQNVQIIAQVKNLGTYSQTLKIEAGIAPDYWQGTIFGQDVNAQSYFTITKCCQGNDYYDAKQITLNAGESENVIFNVKAPTVSSKDACSTNNLFKSAWDSSHTVVVALYSACGVAYVDKDLKDIHVKDKPCSQPSNCNTATEYCKFTGTTGTCQPKVCSDKCTPNTNRCNGNTVQHCEDTNSDGCVEWKDTATCKNGYTCITGTCEYTSVKTMFSLENAGSNTVLKQKGDVVSASLKYVATEPIILEYDTAKFQLDTTTCPGSSFTITTDKTCKFTVIGMPSGTEHSIKLKYGGSGKVKIIQNPAGIVLTHVQKLYQRFPEAQNQVNDLLQKAYNFAYNKNLVVYNLANYVGTAHPWAIFSSYAEQPTNPFMKNNAYSLEVGQLVREKCTGTCKNTIILGDDFVVPHYRRDAQFINNYWIFGQTEKVDHIYSDLAYIGRKDKPFSQFKDLFYFDGEYDGKKVIIIKPSSLSSSMQAELNHFKQVLATKFNPNFVEIQANTVGCNDGTFFSTFDGATLLIVGTSQSNPAYNCMPFVSELESSDTAFIEVNPWDGENYAIIVNTDNSKVLQAFTAFIETNKFEKTTSKVLWWMEVGLDAASYLSILCSGATLLPCDAITDAASTEFYCTIKGSVPLCAVNAAMLAVPYIPAAPVKTVVKKFMLEVGDFAAQLVRDTGDEIIDIFIRAFKRGKLDEVFEVLKKMSNCFATAEYSVQANGCPEKEFYKQLVAKRPRFIIDKAHEMARADNAVLMRASKAGSTTNVADVKFVRMLDSEIPVNDGQIKNFQPLMDSKGNVIKERVGTVQVDGKTYFFKRSEGLQRDMYPANVRERIRHRMNYLLDEKDADIIVPKARMANEVEINVDVDDSGLLVEKVEGTDAWKLYKSVEDRFNNEQFPQMRFFQKTELITEKQKNTMRKMIVRDFVFGTSDRNLGNAVISGNGKVGFIDFEHFLVDIRQESALSPLLKESSTMNAMFNSESSKALLTNMPAYGDLAEQWAYNSPSVRKQILDLLEPEVKKLSSLSDDDVRALFELDDSASQAALQQAREILIGPNGRIKSFISDFYKTKAAVEALQ